MPLRCRYHEQDIYSYNLSNQEWETLRLENKTTHCLHSHCCHAEVVLKVSPLGTRYFAHKRKGKCTTAPESKEHIEAKKQIVEGIQRTDWIAQSEQDGKTPEGNEWTADVLATKDSKQIAFEVQWSRQDTQETKRRQDRYQASKVRCLWFFKQHDFISDKSIPAFQIRIDQNQVFQVYLPSRKYRADKAKKEAECWLPPIPIQGFVEGCLTGRLVYAPVINKVLPLEVRTVSITCRRCKKDTKIITELVFKVEEVFPSCPNLHFSIYTNGIEPWLHQWLPPKLLQQHKIGRLKVRKSFLHIEEEVSYFSNGCVHCDAIQTRYYEEKIYEDEASIKLNIVFSKELAKLFWEGNINYWYFQKAG